MILKYIKQLFSGALLLILPTIIISYPIFEYISEHYSLLLLNSIVITSVFGISMLIAYTLHSTKLRFVIPFGVLILILYLAYHGISSFPSSEFDTYHVANRFRINASIFVLGWSIGFGLSRWRYFPIFFATILITITSIILAGIGELSVNVLIKLLFPVVFYFFYILFIKELLHNVKQQQSQHFGKMLLRAFSFSALLLLLFWLSLQFLQSKFDQIENEIGNAASQENNPDDSMLNKDATDHFDMKDYTQLKPSLGQSEQLLFCAYIDNFFAEGIPNPQYITLYHLNKYNVKLESFEVDPDGPANDLYLPDPTTIPPYFIDMDSSVLVNDKMEKSIKLVETNIYTCQLSPDVFVAPSTAFSCQPISVEKEFSEQYEHAYTVTSEVSELNSAYFVYNVKDPVIQQFQAARYSELRKANNYDDEPADFIEYYTQLPKGKIFDSIIDLSNKLTKGKKTTIDKVLSIRDHFLSRDESGKQVFEYTLTPGSPTDPNIPDASLLYNFLFRTNKGYCTYFAASTFFLLRAQGIPVRLVTGFSTINRSYNNPGWYWYYADQAHAWNQVYFPEYGWMDFDFTISNEEAGEAPQPDGTPPTPPTKAYFVGKGIITALDTINQTLEVELSNIILNEKPVEIGTKKIDKSFDAKQSIIYEGEETIKFRDLRIKDSALVVSFDDKLKRVRPYYKNEPAEKLLKRLPKVININEVHIPPRIDEDEKETDNTDLKNKLNHTIHYLLWLIPFLLVFMLASPYLYSKLLLSKIKRAKSINKKTNYTYKHLLFTINQLGLNRDHLTPLNYAKTVIDPKFGTNSASFINIYLKIKYSQEKITENDKAILQNFYPATKDSILSYYSKKQKLISFLKIGRLIYFLLHLNNVKLK